MKSENFKIRSMKYDDIKHVSNLWNKLSYNQLSRDEYYKGNHEDLLKINNIEYFINNFENENCFIFVAEYNHKIIGFSELWFRKKDFFFNMKDYAYIMHLFVDTTIKKNINPLLVPFQLCKVCEKKAIEHGYQYIGGDVFEFNNQMKSFLQVLEYKPYRIRYMKPLNKTFKGEKHE